MRGRYTRRSRCGRKHHCYYVRRNRHRSEAATEKQHSPLLQTTSGLGNYSNWRRQGRETPALTGNSTAKLESGEIAHTWPIRRIAQRWLHCFVGADSGGDARLLGRCRDHVVCGADDVICRRVTWRIPRQAAVRRQAEKEQIQSSHSTGRKFVRLSAGACWTSADQYHRRRKYHSNRFNCCSQTYSPIRIFLCITNNPAWRKFLCLLW